MFAKILRKYSSQQLTSCRAEGMGSGLRCLHNWQQHNAMNDERRKIVPQLVYLHNPWKYVSTKFNMLKLKWLWDRDFNAIEFIEGAKQAAITMTNIIREQSAHKISEFTTPVGFQQITRDMLLSRNDTRLQLVRFENEHLRRAIPMKVATRHNFGRKYAFIDMLFVGLRNTKDFNSPAEIVEINDILRKMDTELHTPTDVLSVPHRIVFAEIFIRFRRDYTAKQRASQQPQYMQQQQQQQKQQQQQMQMGLPSSQSDAASRPVLPLSTRLMSSMEDSSWSVSFYKILTFDVLNYDPQPKQR